MQNIKILNKKEIKSIIKLIKNQWDYNPDLDYVFFQNNKNRLFIINKELSKIDLNKIRINSIGLYFGELNHNQLRLSIEGSQIIGPKAKKNVLELNKEEVKQWLKGNDLEKETKLKNFVIIKHNNDFLGCGKVKENKLFNYVPKNRRIGDIVE
jgi:NOL1/NOP2/fmu family ribosome biogenesis protein